MCVLFTTAPPKTSEISPSFSDMEDKQSSMEAVMGMGGRVPVLLGCGKRGFCGAECVNKMN